MKPPPLCSEPLPHGLTSASFIPVPSCIDLHSSQKNATMEHGTTSEYDKATIYPHKLTYGVVSTGFLYNLKISVQNNTKSPMRIRVTCIPVKGEKNTIRLVNLPDIIAPGLAAVLYLELTAEFPTFSTFILSVAQNHSSAVYTKDIEANVVSTETFRHVKKSLILQKRPIYESNVKVVANIPFFDTLTDELPNYSSATFSEAVLMDDDDIDDLLSLPMAHNVYWDPFAKCLRIDPKLGKVIVDASCNLDENKAKTAAEREERMIELEEQGFLTVNSIARMREDCLMTGIGLGSPSRSAVFTDDSQLERATITEALLEAEDEDAVDVEGAADAEDCDDDIYEREDTFGDEDFGILHEVNEEGGSDEGESRPRTAERIPGITVTFSEDGDHSRTHGSPSSAASRASVTSLLAMKRERIERQRRESVAISSTFSENSKHDSKIDKDRTLTMIKHKSSKQNVVPGSHSAQPSHE